MVTRLGRHAALATPRKWADFDRGFGIYGDPQHLRRLIGRCIDLVYLVEDRVG